MKVRIAKTLKNQLQFTNLSIMAAAVLQLI